VQEENLGSTKIFVENYLLFTYITIKILALHPWSMGWRNLSKTVEKEFLQPTCSECFAKAFLAVVGLVSVLAIYCYVTR
jgi:hypothetical protein